MITTHPAYQEALEISKKEEKKIHVVLAETLERLRVEEAHAKNRSPADFTLTELTKDTHFYPDLHGAFEQYRAKRDPFLTFSLFV